MRPSYDSDSRVLTLTFDDLAAVEPFVEAMREQNGFLAAVPERLRRGDAVTAALAGPGGFEIRVGARALHVFGPTPDQAPEGLTTAFEIDEWTVAKGMELRRKLADGARGEAAGEEERGETMGSSPIFRIGKMTPPEKARLALKANRTERQILLKETSPQVMMALLNNPHLESDDVLRIVKSPHAPGSILKRVASDRRFSSSLEVKTAVVKNPQTPSVLAQGLLSGLPTSTLKGLARGSEIREHLKKAALKLYLQRMGK